MAFKLGSLNLNAVAQGVGGLVFGTNNYGRDEDDGGVEELLERISNGKLADDRRNAMQELEAAVAENRAAKLAFGAMGECCFAEDPFCVNRVSYSYGSFQGGS